MTLLLRFLSLLSLAASPAWAMEPIGEDELNEVSGQNGVYLSGDLSFNETGGPLAIGNAGNIDPDGVGGFDAVWGTCDEKTNGDVQRCGARISVKTNSSEGYVVLDELRGKLSFEGLTLRARDITAADDDSNFGNDVTNEGFDGKTVLEIGLPNEVRFDEFEMTFATANADRPTDATFQQQNILGVKIDGGIDMQGNLLVFPTGNP